MKLATAGQMYEVDRCAIEERGIDGIALMKNAAKQLADEALKRVTFGGSVLVFCGTGNNGGDGIGAAALLLAKGIKVKVLLIGAIERLTKESGEMKKELEAAGGYLEPFTMSDDSIKDVNDCDVIIDAIFGIGLNTMLTETAISAVTMINSSSAFTISADIPTGVHCDTGVLMGDAVKADVTVTFSLAKPGHFVEPGCIYAGELNVVDIGVPKDIIDGVVSHKFVIMPSDVYLPKRKPDSHKGSYGKVLIVAGSVGYTGAPVLAARAASKVGAGLVSLGVPEAIYNAMTIKLNEEMPFPLPDDTKGKLAANAASEILRRVTNSDVCLIGPGLGRSEEITSLVQSIIHIANTPMVLDADGLNAVAQNTEVLCSVNYPIILTPHTGEFIRLGGNLTSGDRLGAACEFAIKNGCILVLKGHRTIIALPNGTAFVNTTGGPAMAKGGTGDVLAGMITSLIGQKLPIVHAVVAAVYLHGLAGDLCAEKLGEYSVSASDIIEMLPETIKSVLASC